MTTRRFVIAAAAFVPVLLVCAMLYPLVHHAVAPIRWMAGLGFYVPPVQVGLRVWEWSRPRDEA